MTLAMYNGKVVRILNHPDEWTTEVEYLNGDKFTIPEDEYTLFIDISAKMSFGEINLIPVLEQMGIAVFTLRDELTSVKEQLG